MASCYKYIAFYMYIAILDPNLAKEEASTQTQNRASCRGIAHTSKNQQLAMDILAQHGMILLPQQQHNPLGQRHLKEQAGRD